MNEENNNLNPNMNPNISEPKEGSAGPVIGTIIILAVIVLGGLYFWSQRGDKAMDEAEIKGVVEKITTQSQSDDTASIETDLKATDIDNLDKELNAS